MINGLLVTAAKNGNAEGCRALLDRGADIHSNTGEWKSPLHAAVTMGHIETCELLIERGADLKQRFPSSDRTVLMVAAANGDVDLCKLLLDRGCPVNDLDMTQWSAFTLAAMGGHATVVSLLAERGANIHQLTELGVSALEFAVGMDSVETCRVLVGLGLSPSAQLHEKRSGYLTPIQYAAENGSHNAFAFFVEECGEPWQQVSRDGRDIWALAEKSPKVLAYLHSLITDNAIAAVMEHGGVEDASPAISRARSCSL